MDYIIAIQHYNNNKNIFLNFNKSQWDIFKYFHLILWVGENSVNLFKNNWWDYRHSEYVYLSNPYTLLPCPIYLSDSRNQQEQLSVSLYLNHCHIFSHRKRPEIALLSILMKIEVRMIETENKLCKLGKFIWTKQNIEKTLYGYSMFLYTLIVTVAKYI